jgi:RNA polymerase sigma-70 factor (ECF subfamily)
MVRMISTVLADGGMDLSIEDRDAVTASRLEAFLKDVEGRAYRITLLQVSNADDALDIVQDAMIRLVRRYRSRPADQWPPLFYRILQNGTRDWHRRQAVRRKVFSIFTRQDPEAEDIAARMPGPASDDPLGRLQRDGAMQALDAALRQLPARQREAFILRNLEGLDVQQTAAAMGCSDGSVKTHYSRAVHRLREELGEHWS